VCCDWRADRRARQFIQKLTFFPAKARLVATKIANHGRKSDTLDWLKGVFDGRGPVAVVPAADWLADL